MADEGALQWQQLLDQANDGALELNPEVGKDLDNKCQTYLDELDGLRDRAVREADVTGFGTLPSGPPLENKFNLKLAEGDTSLDKSLRSHIKEVQLMRQVFAKAIENFQATDESNAGALPEVGG